MSVERPSTACLLISISEGLQDCVVHRKWSNKRPHSNKRPSLISAPSSSLEILVSQYYIKLMHIYYIYYNSLANLCSILRNWHNLSKPIWFRGILPGWLRLGLDNFRTCSIQGIMNGRAYILAEIIHISRDMIRIQFFIEMFRKSLAISLFWWRSDTFGFGLCRILEMGLKFFYE